MIIRGYGRSKSKVKKKAVFISALESFGCQDASPGRWARVRNWFCISLLAKILGKIRENEAQEAPLGKAIARAPFQTSGESRNKRQCKNGNPLPDPFTLPAI